VGTVDVYTDLGSNGILTGAESDALTANGYAEWTGVATAYFSAAIAGDFSAVALPDIVGANAGLVVGTFNGGGIHVMYDNDGTIVFNFFGAPPGVLGIASPDFSITGTPDLVESWAVLNGTAADPADIAGASFAGVFTHEFGHTINLAHTQTNGAVGFFGDGIGPDLCGTPYGGSLTFADFETMYPFLDPTAGSVGVDQATVNVLDDIAAISDVYPTGGWPNNTGTITGLVLAPDGTTEVTGINVIVRNVADPWEDANSALSGDWTQGDLGPDGLFTLNGLTPGADYVVYIDEIVAGGFSTPPTGIPGNGNEEYWNASESADPSVDGPCDFSFIVPAAGSPVTADIVANGNPNDLGLGDDDFVELTLPFSFPFCGMSYNTVFVGSNGFLTFGGGDTDFSESVVEFLSGPPRIAGVWDDLNPSGGGSIAAETVGPDFVVTYTNVPEFPATGGNNFTITLRADGSYDVDYGAVTAADGIAGRTPGNGAVDPGEIDLTAEPQPIGAGMATVYEEFGGLDNDLDSQSLAFGACVIPDLPEIAVMPDALSAKLLPDEMTTKTLKITNLGDLDLDFNILTDQLFVAATRFQGGVIKEKKLLGGETRRFANEARLARINQDNQSSRPGKPDISPFIVPLPHIFAISLLTEDFNAGFPAGWSVVDNAGTGLVWEVPQAFEGNYTGGTGDAAGASSDGFGPADFDTELRTPTITGFGPNVVLTYTANYQNFANFDFFDVDVSTDGGLNWVTVLSWNEDHGGFFGPPGEQVALNLDPFVAAATEFIVRWRYYDPTTFDFDWYVQIDDVMIVSDEPLTPCSYLSVAPTSGTLPGDGMIDIDVTFDATGFAAGNYDCELIIFSNAANEPRLVVPVDMAVAQEVALDIKPGPCPNIVPQAGHDDQNNGLRTRGLVKTVIVGGGDVDVSMIDVSSLALEGIAPVKASVMDRYSLGSSGNCTYESQDYSDVCTDVSNRRDGVDDVELRFVLGDVLDAMGSVPLGEAIQATLTGNFTDGTCLLGFDCLIVVGPEAEEEDGGIAPPMLVPDEVTLGTAVPNPFNPVTRISYSVPEDSYVQMSVYDIKGRLVERLVAGVLSAGSHTVEWQARGVASGIYFYRLQVGDFSQTKKMILLK
jgi:hypothetical protein